MCEIASNIFELNLKTLYSPYNPDKPEDSDSQAACSIRVFRFEVRLDSRFRV